METNPYFTPSLTAETAAQGYKWLNRMIRLVRIQGIKMDYPVMKIYKTYQ